MGPVAGLDTNFSLENRTENPPSAVQEANALENHSVKKMVPRPDAGGFKPTSVSYSFLASAGPSVHQSKKRQMRAYYSFPEKNILNVFKLADHQRSRVPITV